ncbi:MAG: hypothetical protein ACTH0F_07615, partial [Microbacterium sp.]
AWRGGRWAPAVATCWGLVWIAVGRWAGGPEAPVVATTAVVLAIIVLVVTAWRFRERLAAGQGRLPTSSAESGPNV